MPPARRGPRWRVRARSAGTPRRTASPALRAARWAPGARAEARGTASRSARAGASSRRRPWPGRRRAARPPSP
eukprot:13318805-Alexandrium_andersonii.AAC.1